MLHLKRFFRSEDGAVTVDWVVLTAGVVTLAVVVGSTLTDPVDAQLANIAGTVNAAGE